jgi:AcrR family transcriptional regulator
MARRSDHSRPELEALIVNAGHSHMAEVGFARFSAREVAKRVGYSIGTLYNVFGSLDALILAINARTVAIWAAELNAALAAAEGNRIDALVRGYFAFAQNHRNIWAAIYDHRLPADMPIPDWYVDSVATLTGTMRREVRSALPAMSDDDVAALSRSLLASVHGHCVFAMNGTFDQLGETAPRDAALARVHEAIAGARHTVDGVHDRIP